MGMEQRQQSPPVIQQADCVIVNMEPQVVIASDGGSDNYHVVDVKVRPTDGGQDQVVDVDRLVANVVVDDGMTSTPNGHGETSKNHCMVCGKPMRWVVIGRCGHRVVCSKCMVTNRFFQQNKRCYICNARCPPKVVVAKADGKADGAATLSKLPRFVFRDGRVGNYWYHGYTAAYFEEEKEYQAARAECKGIIPPFYEPKGLFIFWFGLFFIMGLLLGYESAREAKDLSSQVIACALSIILPLLFAALWWFMLKLECKTDPFELECARLERDATIREATAGSSGAP